MKIKNFNSFLHAEIHGLLYFLVVQDSSLYVLVMFKIFQTSNLIASKNSQISKKFQLHAISFAIEGGLGHSHRIPPPICVKLFWMHCHLLSPINPISGSSFSQSITLFLSISWHSAGNAIYWLQFLDPFLFSSFLAPGL
jgi:hypothetical protein